MQTISKLLKSAVSSSYWKNLLLEKYYSEDLFLGVMNFLLVVGIFF